MRAIMNMNISTIVIDGICFSCFGFALAALGLLCGLL